MAHAGYQPGFHPHGPSRFHTFLAKGLGATMWFFIFYRARMERNSWELIRGRPMAMAAMQTSMVIDQFSCRPGLHNRSSSLSSGKSGNHSNSGASERTKEAPDASKTQRTTNHAPIGETRCCLRMKPVLVPSFASPANRLENERVDQNGRATGRHVPFTGARKAWPTKERDPN